MDKTRDLVQFPRTEAETRCVRHILAHFERTLTEYRAGRYKLPSHTADDVRNLLSYPVFLDAWGELKRYHEPETVDFVEQALSRMR